MDEDIGALIRKRSYSRALELLVERYGAKVLGMATMMLNSRPRAEEATQDIFFKVWKAFPAYDGRAAPSTWLYTIARNTCLTALRADQYRKTSALEDIPEPATHPTVCNDLEIAGLLERLPEQQRDIVTLYYLEERSVEEVARLMDLPEGTVKSHLFRARRALGDMLGVKR